MTEGTDVTKVDPSRDAVTRAAAIFDEHSRTINDLHEKLRNAITELESRGTRIEQLEFALAEERTRSTTLQNERDLAIIERSELSVMFYNIKAQLDAFVVQLPPLPRKNKRNGGHKDVPASSSMDEKELTLSGPQGEKGEGMGHHKD